jgi:hypothetical protein
MFLMGVQRDIQKQRATFLQGKDGVEHLSRKTSRVLNERMGPDAAYGRSEVIVYFQSIAHTSYKQRCPKTMSYIYHITSFVLTTMFKIRHDFCWPIFSVDKYRQRKVGRSAVCSRL